MPHPGSGRNRAVQQTWYDLLYEPSVRTVLERTAEAPRTQKWLLTNFHEKSRSSVSQRIKSLALLGALEGSAECGYRLTVGELLDIGKLVRDSPLGNELWALLKKPVGRAVLAALLHGDRARTSLIGTVGEQTLVDRELRVLAAGGAVRKAEIGRELVYDLIEPARYAQILGGVEIIIALLANNLAASGGEAARRIAYPAAPLDDYEPRALRAMDPPDTVSRFLVDDERSLTTNQRAAARMWRDLSRPGLLDPTQAARFKRSLTLLPCVPFPRADSAPFGVAYFDVPHVAEAIVSDLRRFDQQEGLINAMRTMAERDAGTTSYPYSMSQLRGRARIALLSSGDPWQPHDLTPPRILWSDEAKGPHPDLFAATFDATVTSSCCSRTGAAGSAWLSSGQISLSAFWAGSNVPSRSSLRSNSWSASSSTSTKSRCAGRRRICCS